MIWSIVSLIYPILILTVAMCCYKKDGRLMKAFYVRMAYHDVARRFYVLAVMIQTRVKTSISWSVVLYGFATREFFDLLPNGLSKNIPVVMCSPSPNTNLTKPFVMKGTTNISRQECLIASPHRRT